MFTLLITVTEESFASEVSLHPIKSVIDAQVTYFDSVAATAEMSHLNRLIIKITVKTLMGYVAIHV